MTNIVNVGNFAISGCTFSSITKACRYFKISEEEVVERYSQHGNVARAFREVIQDHFDAVHPSTYIYCYCGYKSLWLDDVCERNGVSYKKLLEILDGDIDDKQKVYKALDVLTKERKVMHLSAAGRNRLIEMGISEYTINSTEKLMFNYSLFAKNLVVVENTARKLGITVEEMMKYFKLSPVDVFRKMQYRLDESSLRRKIFSCAQPVIGVNSEHPQTIPDLLKEYGITNQEFVDAHKRGRKVLKGLDLITYRGEKSKTVYANKEQSAKDGMRSYTIYTSIKQNTPYTPSNIFKSEYNEQNKTEGAPTRESKSRAFIKTTECDAIIDPDIKKERRFIRAIDVSVGDSLREITKEGKITSSQTSKLSSLRVKKNKFRERFSNLEFKNYNQYGNSGYWVLSKIQLGESEETGVDLIKGQEVRFLVYDGIRDEVKNFSGKALYSIEKAYPGMVRNIKSLGVLEDLVNKGKYKETLGILPWLNLNNSGELVAEDEEYNPITVTRIELGLVEAYDKFGDQIVIFESDLMDYLKFRGITNVVSGEVKGVNQRAIQYLCSSAE